MQTQRKIVLGITGGIAAYKAAELTRLLVKHNIHTDVVMTKAGQQFITPTTMQALSGHPVHTQMWDHAVGNGMPHIALSRQADAILVAPASADFIAKLAHGRADDLLSTLCLARDCALLIAPAMNKQMWEASATQRNIAQLKHDGVIIFGPATGEQACGEVGDGRMLEAEDLLQHVCGHFTPKLLQDVQVIITAGATQEMIDPVRAITNLSSGKMGYAIAQAAQHMGANVTLISGQTALPPPHGVTYIQANSAEAMYQVTMQTIAQKKPTQYDVFIGVAAVADYGIKMPSPQKIKKSESSLTITLTRNQDILADVARLPNAPFCVGFAAETEDLIIKASQKRLVKKLPLMIANLVKDSLGQADASLTLIDDVGVHALPRSKKNLLAYDILSHIHQCIEVRRNA